MNIYGKSLTFLAGLAAGTAVTIVINRASGKTKRIVSHQKSSYTIPGRKSSIHLYDDSGVYYV